MRYRRFAYPLLDLKQPDSAMQASLRQNAQVSLPRYTSHLCTESMETTSEKIDRFQNHFGSQIDQIAKEVGNYQRGLYARLLLTAMLDTFSQVAFPQDEKTGRRYARFIVEYSDWSDARRVSLIHLGRALEVDSRKELDSIRQWVKERIRTHFPIEESPSLIHHPSKVEKKVALDPSLSEVKERWPEIENKNFYLEVEEKRIDLRYLVHAGLLYQYRNHLVHEFRTPGQGMESQADESPFYQRMSDIDFVGDEMSDSGWSLNVTLQRWELIYPVGFLVRLSRECLRNLHSDLHKQSRSPFSVLSEGTYWIPRLN